LDLFDFFLFWEHHRSGVVRYISLESGKEELIMIPPNKGASQKMVVGMGICAAMAPMCGGLSLMIGVPALLGARLLRGVIDATCEDEDSDNGHSEQEDSGMSGLVPYRGRGLACLDDEFPLMTGLGSSFRPDARTVLASVDPPLAARALRDDVDLDILRAALQAAAPAAFEMAQRHPNPTRMRIRARSGRRLFGGSYAEVDVDFG
jgi:hypothetical protein